MRLVQGSHCYGQEESQLPVAWQLLVIDVPPAIVQQAKQKDDSARSDADRRAKEAARRAVEQGSNKRGPNTSGRK